MVAAPEPEAWAVLIAQVLAGDRPALRRITERLLPRVRTTVTYMVGGHAERDDLVQRALLEVLKSLKGFRGESRFETWVDRIVGRTAMRQIRRFRRREKLVTPMAELPESREEGPIEDPVALKAVRERMSQLLTQLPEERRHAVVLRLVHGYSIQEIAAMTATNFNTVRDRLRVGRAELRKLVETDADLMTLGRGRVP